jgi:hypothetical protein
MVPLLTYASENWTINLAGRRKIESAEMRFLHLVAGYTLLDQKQSIGLHCELKIFSLTERIEKQKKNWCEHVLILTVGKTPKNIIKLET